MEFGSESFSLQQYRLEVGMLPPISEEDVYELGQSVLQARAGEISRAVGDAAKEQIVLGCLHLVLAVAQHYPSSIREDLIQEGNVGLLTAVERCPFNEKGHCIAYLATSVRRAISNAMEHTMPIRIPHSSLYQARKHEMAEPLYEMQPMSLQKPIKGQPDVCLADLLETTDQGCQDTSQERSHQIEELLAQLPPRGREILQLRYGLDERDGRKHSYDAVATKLGMTKNGVMQAERRAIAMLTGERETPAEWRARKLQEMQTRKAAQQEQQSKRADQRKRRQEMASEARLNTAYALLSQQGCAFTSRFLARAAQVSDEAAQKYLRQVQQEAVPVGIGRKTYAKLLQAYCQLDAGQQIAINAHQLSQAAGVKWRAAKLFLDQRPQPEQSVPLQELVEA
jgi:RNA polymerase sigma factor (sigma-70 family)